MPVGSLFISPKDDMMNDWSTVHRLCEELRNIINNVAWNEAMQTELVALQNLIASKSNSSVTAKKPSVYVLGLEQNEPKVLISQAVVSGGNAVFYLTDNNAANGNALFSTSQIFIQPILFASNQPPAFGTPVLSANRKTLTIPVSKAATGISVLGVNVLGANIPANGDTVSIWVCGT